MPLPQADFQSLKQRIPIDWVLAHYGVKLRPAGPHTLYGACPLPTHTSQQSRESFSVNLSRRVWSCHSASCIAAREGRIGGHVIDLVAIMERCGLRQAGLRLQDWFGGRATDPPAVREPARTSAPADPNRPLGFTLQGIDTRHPYLEQRGIFPATARLFGVGMYRGNGFLAGRCVIPHSRREQPVGRLCGTRGPRRGAQIPLSLRLPEISPAVQPGSGEAHGCAQRDCSGRLFRRPESPSSRACRSGVDGNFFLSTPVGTSDQPLRTGHVDARWRPTRPAGSGDHRTVTEAEDARRHNRPAEGRAAGPTVLHGNQLLVAPDYDYSLTEFPPAFVGIPSFAYTNRYPIPPRARSLTPIRHPAPKAVCETRREAA
jgi:hypothetical protein